ncbi:MAG TPA: diadenosine tetraphosphate hydrolase [Candidatus Moranbacteria bacterium]|nr:MAG: NUDIX hydrolase [Candidatus Moranbacteria bacterium GW2011_GWC2_45_10]KKT95016.1 MAG: NUDIX hydrolase [Parcubacteria group bacterium GW2011_GWC1_45_14]HAV11533.1 diadenosine tetraphosphate hydrolase [Candidatus Moranbacteria bacterium]
MKIGKVSFEKSVGAVIFREEGGEKKFLLLKYRSGQWDFPKGHVDEGETEKETLAREIREETGITQVEIKEGFRTTNRFFYTAKGNEYKERMEKGKGVNIFKRAVYYLAKTKKAEVVLDFENKGYVWAGFEKAISMLGNEGSKRTLKKARSFLEKSVRQQER